MFYIVKVWRVPKNKGKAGLLPSQNWKTLDLMIGKVIIDALGCARSLNVNENTHISLAATTTVH